MTAATRTTSTTRSRRLEANHFAFMRSLVQGLDPKDTWERYMGIEGEASDQRVVRSTIAWIRDEFAAAARRFHRHGTARLVLLDISKIPQADNTPTLEEFAQAQGLEDFSQAEQIEAFEAEYGSRTTQSRRRARMLERQLEALAWLEQLVAQAPQRGDGVAAWLNPTLSNLLHAGEIFTVEQLLDRINGLGQRWWRGVKGLGSGKASRIQAWLVDHEGSLGARVGSHVALKSRQLLAHELSAVVPAATAVRPLEKFIVPAELDGRAGRYRLPQAQCLMDASDDLQAILAWLRAKRSATPEQKTAMRARRRHKDIGVESGLDWLKTLTHTQRAYRKEAERFLLWAIVERKKPLSSMAHEDCVAYRDFLADPAPRSRWCGPRARQRWSPLWRPFEGPLQPGPQAYALTVLSNLYSFLNKQNYLAGNPWSSIARPKALAPKLNATRSLTQAQWLLVLEQLEQLPEASTTQRLRFALHLAYDTGLRASELVAATVDHLQWVSHPPDAHDVEAVEGWVLTVVGKGMRQREVPISDRVVDQLSRYLGTRGLPANPLDNHNRGAFLLGQALDVAERAPWLVKALPAPDPKAGITAGTIYGQMKQFFEHCTQVLRHRGDLRGSSALQRASTHWLRHTHATHALAQGMPIEMVQKTLGHTSLNTTTIYVSTEEKRHMQARQKYWGGK